MMVLHDDEHVDIPSGKHTKIHNPYLKKMNSGGPVVIQLFFSVNFDLGGFFRQLYYSRINLS